MDKETGQLVRTVAARGGDPNVVTDNQHEDHIRIFTDGSKQRQNNGLVGSACSCPDLGIQVLIGIDNNASIFTAESIALYEAVKIAAAHQDRNFLVLSDSLSSLNYTTSPTFNIRASKYILQTKELLFNKNNEIKFQWVPSHRGVEGNEDVDRLANEAANLEPNPNYKIPFSDFAEKFRHDMLTITENKIDLARDKNKGKEYFQWFCEKKKENHGSTNWTFHDEP